MKVNKVTHTFTSDPNDPRLALNHTDDIADEIKAIFEKHGIGLGICVFITKDNKGRFIRTGDHQSCIMLAKAAMECDIIDAPGDEQ